MKNFITLIALFFGLQLIAQGISVQGIARDNANSAITNTSLPFTFNIVNGSTIIFTETQDIKTDNFGLFSHVVSSGTTTLGNFNNIDFSIQDLKLQVVVQYEGGNVTVYDQVLQYVPYAHYAKKATDAKKAENGVPPGTIVAFLGDDSKIPNGWVKAMGQDISSGAEYAALRAVIGNTIPDLRARFLRGQGISSNIDTRRYDENTTVGQYLDQTVAKHRHFIDITKNVSSAGTHSHAVYIDTGDGYIPHNSTQPISSTNPNPANAYSFDHAYGAGSHMGTQLTTRFSDRGTWSSAVKASNSSITKASGEHQHSVHIYNFTEDVAVVKNGDIDVAAAGEENRPYTVVVNYIIKL